MSYLSYEEHSQCKNAVILSLHIFWQISTISSAAKLLKFSKILTRFTCSIIAVGRWLKDLFSNIKRTTLISSINVLYWPVDWRLSVISNMDASVYLSVLLRLFNHGLFLACRCRRHSRHCCWRWYCAIANQTHAAADR